MNVHNKKWIPICSPEWSMGLSVNRTGSIGFCREALKEPRDSNVGILENKSTLLTISRLWRYCGPSNYRSNFLLYWYAPWVFFEVVNVLSCSPFMFENTENKLLTGEFATVIWRLHCFTVSFRGERPRRIRPHITRLSQLENSAMGTWPIYKNSIIPDWFEKWRDIKFWCRC